MKIKELINTINDKKMLNGQEIQEIKRRQKQLKAYYMLDKTEKMRVVVEMVSNMVACYYIDFDNNSIEDIIENVGLHEEIETGHVTYMEI